MPPFSDSPVGSDSDSRRAMLSKGIALRFLIQAQYAQNTFEGPVAPDRQVYIGQRPFEGASTTSIFTADLRQLHLSHAQLNIVGVWNWASWNPAGPKTFEMSSLFFYKAFGEDRVEIKAGYNNNNVEFIGLQVGGSVATGTQGVYAVLPYEVGMASFPLTAPSFVLRLRGPKRTYLRTAAQRSLDAAGAPATVARNRTGFRFIPKGDKLLLIEEVGYQRASSPDAHEAWFRAGYMRNSTLYTNEITGQKQPGNYCAFALMDYQLRSPDPEHPEHGLYVGGSAMTVPATLNAYARYYEARLYQKAPFRSRPCDVLSFVISHTGYSKFAADHLIAEGKTVWRSSTSLTGSYFLRVAPGNYFNVGLSYIHGPAITPRVPDTLTFIATYGVYF